ncbi:MAG: ABC transporter ATP-binding protein [Desulfobacteraceae bacterium]|nr:MAG: ABC transporter ATP-binding protein [Desulfobacteraceae bacterium]
MDGFPVLELKGISKSFHGVMANSGVDFKLKKGEIHALLGENGAGKSTLMNMICGLLQPDRGEIFIQGNRRKIQNPKIAIQLGVGMIHQHFMIVPGFTSLENIILGSEPVTRMAIDFRKARKQIAALSDQYGFSIDPDAVTEDLPVGIQQRVEIFKALYRKVGILILDEPTAVLTPQETEDLFRVMRRLARKSVSIIFITHKLREVMQIADSITVMQRGAIKGVLSPGETDEQSLARMMIGREINMISNDRSAGAGRTVFEASGLSVNSSRGFEAVSDVSFCVREGEIVGIAGIQGNGQMELSEAIAGLREIASGNIILSGKVMPALHPRKMMENGLAHIPEDRLKYGLVLPFSIAENQILCTYYRNPFARFMWRNRKAMLNNSRELMDRFDIRAGGPEESVKTLSGGNQQKVIISREFSRNSIFLLANQPTRGLDVGSIEYVHRQMLTLRDKGAGILLISSELDEILSLADSILVIYRGRLISMAGKEGADRASLGLMMTRGLEREK